MPPYLLNPTFKTGELTSKSKKTMIKALTEARKVNLRLGSPIHAPTRRNEKEGKCKAKTENFQKIIPSDSGQTSQKEGHRKTRRSSMKPVSKMRPIRKCPFLASQAWMRVETSVSVHGGDFGIPGGDFGIQKRRLRYPLRRLRNTGK